MAKLEYGNLAVESEVLPAVAIEALIRRGWSHYMGNEQASKVSAWKDKPENADATDEAIAKVKGEYQAAALKALLDGTVGTSNRGPRGSAAETIARQNAEKEVRARLKAHGLTLPSGDKVITFPNGDKLTRVQLIDRRMAAHGERLIKEAEAEIKRREREAAKAGLDDLLAGGEEATESPAT